MSKDQPGFTAYASRILNSTFSSPPDTALFYSTYSTRDAFLVAGTQDDDILGASDEGVPFRSGRAHSDDGHDGTGRRLSIDDDDRSDDGGGGGGAGGVGMSSHADTRPASRLWERAPALPAFSMSRIPGLGPKGWRTHESVLPTAVSDVYQERDEDDYSDSDDLDNSPPSFLSPTPLPPQPNPPTEPLLQPRTLFIYPSAPRSGTRTTYQNSNWIVAYGLCVLGAAALALEMWWTSSNQSHSPETPTLFPTLPTLSLLSLLSLLAGISALSYILCIRDAVKHLVAVALVGGPLVLVGCGVVSWAGSFGSSGAESDRGWKIGVRWFGTACFLAAFVLGRVGLARRKSVSRTIKVLELAGTIIVSHPPLILLCLALSLLSTVLTIPFLFVLASLLSDRSSLPLSGWIPHGALGWGSVAVLAVYLWTLAIARGVQRVTVAGVVGAWYFERHEPTYPSPFEVTKAAFARASGPSLGTTIAAGFLLAIFETLEFVLRRLRAALRSSNLPIVLHPLTCLIPLISIASASIEAFNGWVLCYAALGGDDFLSSAGKVRRLLRANGTTMLGDNLLVKLILFITSLAWGLGAGVVAFLISSTQLEDARLAPLVAVLCFLVPMWTMKLCQGIIGDAADTLFVAFNMDLEKNTSHCHKAVEAFREPDTESLA